MALVEGLALAKNPPKEAEVLIGEDWEGAKTDVEQELHEERSSRSFIRLHSSPIARKIVVFNLLALVILVAGILFINPFRDSLVAQREAALRTEAQLVADVFEALLPAAQPDTPADEVDAVASEPDQAEAGPATKDTAAQIFDPAAILEKVDTGSSTEIRVYAVTGDKLAGPGDATLWRPGSGADADGVLDKLSALIGRITGGPLQEKAVAAENKEQA